MGMNTDMLGSGEAVDNPAARIGQAQGSGGMGR